MQETMPIIFSVVLIILVIVLSVVGVYMVLVLMELRRTLKKVNTTLDTAEIKLHEITLPLQRLGGMASGLTTGFKVFEAFTSWLQRDKDK